MQRDNLHLIPSNTSLKRASGLTIAQTASTKRQLKQASMAPALIHILNQVQHELSYQEFEDGVESADSKVLSLIEQCAKRSGIKLSEIERDEILEKIEKDKKQFGILQELVDDPEVTDIIVSDYSKIAVQKGRTNLSTDLSFASQETYQAFVERLLHRAGSSYSTKKPIADGMIGSFARVHVVHKCLCEAGPYLTIRLNRFPAISVSDLERLGLAPKAVLSYLQCLVKAGQTMLIVGEVGTGKTTLVRALAASMPAQESILVIEDTPEIRLEHPHVRYIRTRHSNADDAGKVTPSQCIRAGMRMAMNRIIFGEIRDAEAAENFIDVCASGHPGLSTIHARNSSEAIGRLELFLARAQKGVEREVIYQQIAKAVQLIVFVNVCSVTSKRRIMDVREIGPMADKVIRHREIFSYECRNGSAFWKIGTRASKYRDILASQNIYLEDLPALMPA